MTINIMKQLKKHGDIDGDIDCNFLTYDRMLQYKITDFHFFTDTFKAKDGYKSARGYIYCQLFVSDKGFVYTVPMKKRSYFCLDVKEFSK